MWIKFSVLYTDTGSSSFPLCDAVEVIGVIAVWNWLVFNSMNKWRYELEQPVDVSKHKSEWERSESIHPSGEGCTFSIEVWSHGR